MRSSSSILLGLMAVAFLLVPVSVGNTFAAGSRVTKHDGHYTLTTPQEEVKKMKGVVVKREPDSFTMSETTGGPTTTVNLTSSTEVKSHKKGVFRGSKDYAASYILRGLRLEVDGVRNSDGSITAEKIRFDEQDLRTAQALKATVDPVEQEMNEKLRQQQAESERLAGQIEENRALTPRLRRPKKRSRRPTTPTIASTAWTISIRSRRSRFTSLPAARRLVQRRKLRSMRQPPG